MELIKKLRDETGAGIVDCKKALEESGDDIDKAIEILRKKGIAKAAKRGERETKQGIIKLAVSDDAKEGYMVEVNAETDFVVRNEKFQAFAEEVLNLIKNKKPQNREELMKLDLNGVSVEDALSSLSGVIGEKLDIKRCDVLASSGTVAVYSHMGGKIGVAVSLDKEGQSDLAYDIAMQIAAANPKCITPEEVPAEDLEKEKDIYRAQLKKEGKPEEMIEKIMQGKLNKYFEEICLVDQEYIKDDKKKVRDVLGQAKIEKFVRYSL